MYHGWPPRNLTRLFLSLLLLLKLPQVKLYFSRQLFVDHQNIWGQKHHKRHGMSADKNNMSADRNVTNVIRCLLTKMSQMSQGVCWQKCHKCHRVSADQNVTNVTGCLLTKMSQMSQGVCWPKCHKCHRTAVKNVTNVTGCLLTKMSQMSQDVCWPKCHKCHRVSADMSQMSQDVCWPKCQRMSEDKKVTKTCHETKTPWSIGNKAECFTKFVYNLCIHWHMWIDNKKATDFRVTK